MEPSHELTIGDNSMGYMNDLLTALVVVDWVV